MRNSAFVLACTLLLSVSCDRGDSGGGGSGGGSSAGGSSAGGVPNVTGGAPTGGMSAAISGDSPEPASGGVAFEGTGGELSGSGGFAPTSGGAGGASPGGENDPSCPAELPVHESTCFVYPFIVCSYEGAVVPLGGNCICAAQKWDCIGCPAEVIQGETDCAGYEGEACGACSCSSDGNSTWDCGIEF